MKLYKINLDLTFNENGNITKWLVIEIDEPFYVREFQNTFIYIDETGYLSGLGKPEQEFIDEHLEEL